MEPVNHVDLCCTTTEAIPTPVNCSGNIWHQPAYNGVSGHFYVTGDVNGRGGRILFYEDDGIYDVDLQLLSDYIKSMVTI